MAYTRINADRNIKKEAVVLVLNLGIDESVNL